MDNHMYREFATLEFLARGIHTLWVFLSPTGRHLWIFLGCETLPVLSYGSVTVPTLQAQHSPPNSVSPLTQLSSSSTERSSKQVPLLAKRTPLIANRPFTTQNHPTALHPFNPITARLPNPLSLRMLLASSSTEKTKLSSDPTAPEKHSYWWNAIQNLIQSRAPIIDSLPPLEGFIKLTCESNIICRPSSNSKSSREPADLAMPVRSITSGRNVIVALHANPISTRTGIFGRAY